MKVISAISKDLFDRQTAAYQRAVLPLRREARRGQLSLVPPLAVLR